MFKNLYMKRVTTKVHMKITYLAFLVACFGTLAGCAMSMPASQFYTEFPAATHSLYLNGADARVAIIDGTCIELGEHRYAAPIGLTVHDDLRNGAEGVDVIVTNEGGNAYRLASYVWVPMGDGSTQLQIDFHTLLCKFTQPEDEKPTTTST